MVTVSNEHEYKVLAKEVNLASDTFKLVLINK